MLFPIRGFFFKLKKSTYTQNRFQTKLKYTKEEKHVYMLLNISIIYVFNLNANIKKQIGNWVITIFALKPKNVSHKKWTWLLKIILNSPYQIF